MGYVPQVYGPVRDTLDVVEGILETEINAVTDNPLIIPILPDTRTLKAVSGGNFHAEYVAFAADFLSIVVTEIGNITERRLFRLDDGTLNRGLPDMLVASEKVGLDCGFMLPQYLAAALVPDCKTLVHPSSTLGRIALAEAIAGARLANPHVFACGPERLLETLAECCPAESLRVERFTGEGDGAQETDTTFISNETMMICVSRCVGQLLILEL